MMTEAQARALLPQLQSADANKRLDAALKLGYPGWTFAVPELMRLAKSDPDIRVRKAAIISLGAIADPSALKLLESIWKNTSEPHDVRQEALGAYDRILDDTDGSDDDVVPGSAGGGDSLGGI
jgi:HEAT repeat protein